MNSPARILVVDDSEAIRYAVAHLMRQSGYEVYEAASGQECIDQARAKKPDLILLDIMLPDFDGLEAMRRLKADAETKDIFVVHLSAQRASSDERMKGLRMGADGYIAQPVDNAELAARVAAFLRHKKTIDDLRASEAQYRGLYERFARELTSVGAAGIPEPHCPTGPALRERAADSFKEITAGYINVLHAAFEQRIYKSNAAHSKDVQGLAERLYAHCATGRDVLEVHYLALKRLAPTAESPRSQAFIEVGRFTILELLSHLLARYRAVAMRAGRLREDAPAPSQISL